MRRKPDCATDRLARQGAPAQVMAGRRSDTELTRGMGHIQVLPHPDYAAVDGPYPEAVLILVRLAIGEKRSGGHRETGGPRVALDQRVVHDCPDVGIHLPKDHCHRVPDRIAADGGTAEHAYCRRDPPLGVGGKQAEDTLRVTEGGNEVFEKSSSELGRGLGHASCLPSAGGDCALTRAGGCSAP
jgi:hypothetical protein